MIPDGPVELMGHTGKAFPGEDHDGFRQTVDVPEYDVVVEDAVDGVILQHVGEVVGIEKVVDSDDFDVITEILDCRAEDHASDSSETVDTDFDCHSVNPSIRLLSCLF